MRFDALLLDHPSQHLGRAVSRVADQTLRLDPEPLLHPVNHESRGIDLGGTHGARRRKTGGASSVDPPISSLGCSSGYGCCVIGLVRASLAPADETLDPARLARGTPSREVRYFPQKVLFTKAAS